MPTFTRPAWCALTLLALALVLPPGATAGPPPSLDGAAVDALVQESLKTWQVPGAAVAVIRGEDVLYLRGAGLREVGKPSVVTADTVFAVGSTTKAFTSTAMAMLVDEGRMGWDDPVRKHVESFRLSDPLADQNATLRDLVTHRTGLSRHDMLWYSSPWSREEIVRRIGLVKLNRPFRSSYQYQNVMFLVAGMAVGNASKSTWDEVMQKRIFDPLGMANANVSTTVLAKVMDKAEPHVLDEGKLKTVPWANLDNVGPAGSVNASARDLSRWVRFQLAGGVYEGKRLVSEENLLETRTPQMVMRLEGGGKLTAEQTETTQMTYGMGWQIQDYRGHLLTSHGGNIDGFTARVALLPKDKIGIVVLANRNGSLMNTALSHALSDMLLGLPKKDWNAWFQSRAKAGEEQAAAAKKALLEKRKKDTRPSRELASYCGTYVEPAYGTAKVTLDNGALMLEWSSFKTHLEHWHFDTFTAKGNDALDDTQVTFSLDAEGEVTKLNALGQEFIRAKMP
jgi:CubicO group peptidase (beta-lactamase class C family)